MGDNKQNIFESIEDRWEAGSQGLMRLMEFSLELLKDAEDFLKKHDFVKAKKALILSADFVITGAKLMKVFGKISPDEYNKFRYSRDILGSKTDKRIIEIHKKQKIVVINILKKYFEIIPIDINKAVNIIKKDKGLYDLTKAIFSLNNSHKVVFESHKHVCTRAVEQGKKSIRGGEINMLENKDFADSLDKLKTILNSLKE